MSGPDDGLRSIFHTQLRAGFHWQAIESGLTGGGIPDSNFCAEGGLEGWVEHKATKEWAVTLIPEQVGWLVTRARRGGRVFIAVRRRCTAGVRRVAADELWLLRGSYAAEAKRGGLRGLPPAAVLGVWSGGPSCWSWEEVAYHLRGPVLDVRRGGGSRPPGSPVSF